MQSIKSAFEDVRTEVEKPTSHPIRIGEVALRLFVAVLQYLRIRPREIELLQGQMEYTLHWGQRLPGTDMNPSNPSP